MQYSQQVSSASQMTAAKVMDIISRPPGCSGQAADAVSACTQVKMEGAPKLLRIPKSEYPDLWIRLPRHIWPKSWSNIEDPVVLLERNLHGHPFGGLLCGKTNLWKFYWDEDRKRCRIGNAYFVPRKQRLCLSVFVDDVNMAGKKQNMAPMWKKVMKNWSWRTNIISWPCIPGMHSTWTQRYSNYVFLLEQLKNYRVEKAQRRWPGPTTWKDMLENALSDTVNWQTKKIEQLYEVSNSLLGWTITSRRRNWNQWENFPNYAHKVSLKNLYLARIGWPGHSLVSKETCWISHQMDTNTNRIVMWETLQNNARWDCFKTPIIRWNIVHFWRSDVCSNQQFYRSWNYFSRCRFTRGWDSRFRSLG